MPDAAVTTSANTRSVTLARRVLFYSLLTAAISVANLAFSMSYQPFTWTGALTGVIVLGAGFQTANAHGLLARLAPEQARSWMMTLAYALYAGGSLLVGAGLLQAVQRFATP